MIQNKDVDFYQTTTFTGETPSIHLTNEVFYGGFALANPLTLKTFIDETIYTVQAVFVSGHKEGNDWVFVPKPLEVEVCQLEKFGEKYRDIFKTKIENLYCLKEMDYMMEGHTTYDVYSYFQITFYPCVNTTENNNKCKPSEVILAALGLSLVTVKIQDIELTPENYNTPTEVRGKELASPAYLNLYQGIQAYFHIVHVETDVDFIGFELFKNIQTKTFFKYDGTFILPSINTVDLTDPTKAYCHISIQLTEQILTLKRTNTKLTEVLGEVGGLMEVVFSLFRIISSFLTDNLYEQSLVNHLFSFDLDKKTIDIKQKKSKKKCENEDVKIYNPILISPKPILKSINMNDDFTVNTKNKLSGDVLDKKNTNQDNLLVARNLKVRKKKKKHSTKIALSSNLAKIESNEIELKNMSKNKNEIDNNNIYNQNIIQNQDINNYNISSNEVRLDETAKEKGKEKENDNRKIINKIKISKWLTCCCFLCVRKFNNIQNILLNEGMRIIMEKLDIIFLFEKIHKDDEIQKNYHFKEDYIKMSDECKQKLQKFYNSNLIL